MHYGEQTKAVDIERLEREKSKLIRKGNVIIRVDADQSRRRHSSDSGEATRHYIRYKKKGPPKNNRKQDALRRIPARAYAGV